VNRKRRQKPARPKTPQGVTERARGVQRAGGEKKRERGDARLGKREKHVQHEKRRKSGENFLV